MWNEQGRVWPNDDDRRESQYRSWQDSIPALLDSFIAHPWKGGCLRELCIDGFVFDLMDEEAGIDTLANTTQPILSIVQRVRTMLSTPDLLPNLEKLDICTPNMEELVFCSLIDALTLLAIPRNLRKLTHLVLVGCFAEGVQVSTSTFRAFLRGFQTPLQTLSLGQASWVTDKLVRIMAQEVGLNLTCLEILHCGNLTDRSMQAIAAHCPNLTSFSVTYQPRITADAIASVIWRCREPIQQINVSNWSSTGDLAPLRRVLMDLPNLKSLRANFCRWFDNGWVRELVQKQNARGTLVLQTLSVVRTNVTTSSLRDLLKLQPSARIEMGYCTRGVLEHDRATWAELAKDFRDATFAPVPIESVWGSTYSPCPAIRFGDIRFGGLSE